MSVALAGEKRFTLSEAAEALGACYETVRRYVVDRKEVPSERRGKPSNPKRPARGCKVFIDENGLETLREILPPNSAGAPAGSMSPRSASTGSAQGL